MTQAPSRRLEPSRSRMVEDLQVSHGAMSTLHTQSMHMAAGVSDFAADLSVGTNSRESVA